MCSLRTRDGSRHVCGATLLTPRLALTAAYCVNFPGGVPSPVLWCGLHNLYDQDPSTFDVLEAAAVIMCAGADGGRHRLARQTPRHVCPLAGMASVLQSQAA